jgi:general secretion pathway protein G
VVGLTLTVELIVAFTIMLVLTTLAVPLARSRIRGQRERALHQAVVDLRRAIDRYKDYCDANYLGPQKAGTNCYPETLDVLVEGVKLPGPNGQRLRFLRRIPRDPFTGNTDWGLHSDTDDPSSSSWGGQNVFDVYTKTTDKGPDGMPYSRW